MLHPHLKDGSAAREGAYHPDIMRTTSRDFVSQSVIFDVEGGEPELDEPEEDVSKASTCNFCGILKFDISLFFPAPFAPILAIVFVMIGVIISMISEEDVMHKSIYLSAVIVAFDIALLIGCLIARLIVMYTMQRFLPEGNYWVGLGFAIDPYITYLLWAIITTALWGLVLVPVNMYNQNTGIKDHFTMVFLVGKESIAPLSRLARKYVMIAHFTGLLWIFKDTVVCLIMFYFLIGLYKNLNGDLVEYLNFYGILRQLNSSCVRLRPVERNVTATIAPASIAAESIASSAHALQRKLRRYRFFRRFMCKGPPPVERPMSGHLHDFGGADVDAQSAVPTMKSTLVPEPINRQLSMPRQRVKPRAMSNASATTMEIGNLKQLFTRTGTTIGHRPSKAGLREYNVEMTGKAVPSILSRERIEATKKHSLQNLLAVQYVDTNPPVLFVKDSPVELLRKSIAKDVGARLFDELMSFRLSVAERFDDTKGKMSVLFPEEFPVRMEPPGLPPGIIGAVPSTEVSTSTGVIANESPSSPAFPGTGGGGYLHTPTTGSEIHHHESNVLICPTSGVAITAPASLPPGEPLPANPVAQLGQGSSLGEAADEILPSMADGKLDVIYEDPGETTGHETCNGGAVEIPRTNEETVLPLDALEFGLNVKPPVQTVQIQRQNDQMSSSYQPELFEITVHAPSDSEDTPEASRPASSGYTDPAKSEYESPGYSEGGSDVLASQGWPPTFRGAPEHFADLPTEFSSKSSRQTLGSRLWMSSHRSTPPPCHTYQKTIQQIEDDNAECLTRDLIEIFLTPEQTDLFFKLADNAGHGRINKPAFRRVIVQLYLKRKQMLAKCRSHDSIQGVMRNLVTIFVGVAVLLVLLLVVGIDVNTLLLSGAAIVSSITVALSFIYSSFVQSVVFLAFYNPYNISDRVRIDGGAILVVKAITTFNTTFETLEGRPVMYSHTVLLTKYIVNDSRSLNATLNFRLQVLDSTPARAIESLNRYVETYCRTHKSEYVKDSYFFLIDDLSPGHYITLSFWMTLAESWHKWRFVWTQRTKILLYTVRKCGQLGITYKLPVQRFENFGPVASASPFKDTPQLGPVKDVRLPMAATQTASGVQE